MIQKFKSHIFPLLLILFFSLYGIKAFFHSGYFTSHDSWTQVTRLYYFDEAIRNGQIPPRFSFNLLSGFGYPLFTFSYHFPWIIAEPFVLAGMSIFDALKSTFIIGYIISGLLMYLFLSRIFDRIASFTGAFIYLWAPYRFSTLFVRGAMGEAISYVFIPLIFLAFIPKISLKQKLIFGVIGISGLILTHSMIMFLILIPFVLYLMISFIYSQQKIKFLKWTVVIWVLGILLTAYYLIPALVYQPITIFSEVKRNSFVQQFPSLKEILYSPWGYGASFIGAGQMSMQLGITQWIIIGFATFLFIYFIAKRRKVLFKNYTNSLSLISLCSFFIMLFLMLPQSKPVWHILKNFVPIDFPWRILSVLTFLAAFIAAYIVYTIHKQYLKYFVVIFFIFLALYSNRNHIRVNLYTDVPLWLYIASETTTTQYKEYLPYWANRQEITQGIKKKVAESQGNITNESQTINEVKFTHESQNFEKVRVNNIYFPGVQAYIDTKPAPFSYKDSGLIDIEVPQGKHDISVKYRETLVGKIGITVSIITILLLLLILKKYKT